MNAVIYAFDVGSTRTRKGVNGGSRFAWARKRPGSPIEGNDSKADLVCELREELSRGVKIALGIESPLFIPIPKQSEHLSKGRMNEGNRSFAAPVGLAVTNEPPRVYRRLQSVRGWSHGQATPVSFRRT